MSYSDNFNGKDALYLLLFSLVYGLLPVMLFNMPDMFGRLNPVENHFPFWFSDAALRNTHALLVLPLLFILQSHLTGGKAYHGIWAAVLCVGMLIKHSEVSSEYTYHLIAMLVAALVNAYAYMRYTGTNIRAWLINHYGYGKTKKEKAYYPTQQQKPIDMTPVHYYRNKARKAKFNFSFIIGNTELKERLLKAGRQIKENNGKRNGILLTGEPGNGKTTLLEGLAGELNLPIIDVDFGKITSKWVGETTEQVMTVFSDAEQQAPCVLFIDEIEAILVDRNKVQSAESESAKIVSSILKRLEDIRQKGVVVVAATNYLDRLDPAAIREGRFDYKIEVTSPDLEARKHILMTGLKSIPTDKVSVESVARVAKRWEGYSIARLVAVATEVTERFNDKKILEVGFDEMISALRSIQSSKGSKLSETALSFKDLILKDEEAKSFKKLLDRMENMELVEEMGGTLPRGCLFFGPAGTGKTALAQALAKDSGWSFLSTSGHDLLRNPESIDQLITKAKDIRPCIIFIDEADDVLADRQSSILSKDVTNKLLTVMDGSNGRVPDLMFIAATNHPDMVDDAMLRGGRFTEKFEFSLPGKTEVHKYIEQWKLGTKTKLGTSFITENVVDALIGQPLSNINEVLKLAVNESIDFTNATSSYLELEHVVKALSIVKGKV